MEATDEAEEMGLAMGGLMRQRIHEDAYGLESWHQEAGGRCFVHILNSQHFQKVTGSAPPQEPPTAEHYSRAGLPWFELYDADRPALEGAPPFQQVESLTAKRVREGQPPPQDSAPIHPEQVVGLDGGYQDPGAHSF